MPAPVRSYPGFLVNWALIPYLLEALVLMEEGLAPEAIDQAAVAFGMPMGPIELADQVGLDIGLDVGRMLIEAVDKPMAELPDWLVQKVAAGEVGKKAGQGFYRWRHGKPRKAAEAAPGKPAPSNQASSNQETSKPASSKPATSEEITDRLLLPLLDACVECLREGVSEDADLLDGTLIFATGFAPFRGGPLHYARTRGADALVGRMKALAERHGERFQPRSPGWSALQTNLSGG
nr:3-hydroxyacyl-CoA dehydrogenase family protein [Halochromatium glycolicum]